MSDIETCPPDSADVQLSDAKPNKPIRITKRRTSRRKRVFDVVFSLSLLILLSPLLLGIGIFIKLVSKGPALYPASFGVRR